MKIGIVGLPYVGKTSIFNALTQSNAETGSYVARQRTNVNSIKVPDERLEALNAIFEPKKITPATIDYVDVAGVSKGDMKQSELEAGFIAELREVDALAHVLRIFEDEVVPHVDGSVDAMRDIETINIELAFADLQIIEKRRERLVRELRVKKAPELSHELIVLERCKETLEENIPLREIELSPEDERMIRGYGFLTQKPMLLICNIGEDQLDHAEKIHTDFAEYEGKPKTEVVTLSAKLEMEISQLDEEDVQIFIAEMGLGESALVRFIHTSYHLLELITFFTGNPNEVRASTLHQGQTAIEAAGSIHTDFARGFIRAETIHWSDLVDCGSLGKAREKGLLRLEGKEYVVQDGDVLNIRFNV
ncbi:redox-regulated ATPase YchF [Candidatus Poribacteria bacterium]|nr:redox-regulated ATPase YchF [Candidatus Poribacteria bacterium]